MKTDRGQFTGLLFQMECILQGNAYRCLISREQEGTEKEKTVRYRAAVLNEEKASIEEFINALLVSMGAGSLPALPIALPSLDFVMVEHEKREAVEAGGKSAGQGGGTPEESRAGLTGIHIGLSSGSEKKEPLGNFDLWLRGRQLAFLIQVAPPIRLSGIPLGENVFQEKDGISGITVAWSAGAGSSPSRFGVSFVVSLGEWRQELAFGCLGGQEGKTGEDGPGKDPRTASRLAAAALLGGGRGTSAQPEGAPAGREKRVEKKKGPFAIKKIGVEFRAPEAEGEELKVFLKFHVLLSFSVLDMEMMGLKLGLPLKTLTSFQPSDLKKLEFDMEGLSVDFQNHGLMISGALRKTRSSYSGAIRVRFKSFELSAVGAYEKLPDGSHSLFIWLLVRFPIGGPPAFFITGLAAGFGLNRRLRAPEIGQVKDFPLVALARGTSASRAPGAGEVLGLLDQYIAPEKGSYFIALGIEFTTFELLRTFALGIVTFGTELEIHLLGITTLALPPAVSKPLVYAELLLKVSVLPGKGVLSLEGQLSGESYLFDRNCKLTGGFAMYIWFGDNPHAGDFVVTIGGYHPQFLAPSHYPAVDRVGVKWTILPQLTMEGGAYFAVTPVGIMAGGGLSILYQWGNLRAWFIANADFLMQWAPVRYDISVQVSVGISYTFHIFGFRKTLQVELGASLHLYGPEFAGEVRISWYIISFTIRFGQRNASVSRLSYMEFKSKFLNDAQKFRAMEGTEAREQEGDEDSQNQTPLLNGTRLKIALQSRIPMTRVWLCGRELTTSSESDKKFGVLPMGEENSLDNQVQITLERMENGVFEPYTQALSGNLDTESVPPALWGLKTPDINGGERLLPGAVTKVYMWLSQPDSEPEQCYDKDILTENEKIRRAVPPLAACYRKKKENEGKNLEMMLEEWVREHQKGENDLLIALEGRKIRTVAALGTMFPLWEAGERGNLFLVEPTVRTLY